MTSPNEPWRRDGAAVAEELGTDLGRGLGVHEAAIRLERYGPNELDAPHVVPAWRKLLAQFADPLIYLLLAAVIVSVVAWAVEGAEGVPYEAIVIAVIVVLNGVLGFVQEARAEQAVAALRRMAGATASVVRDGLEQRVPTAEVVPGDLLLLSEGDAVSADGRLVEAASLSVAEASLTGESEPVLKDVEPLTAPAGIGDRLNMVFDGTAVTRGRGRAVVTATGMATEIGNVARLLGATEEQPTPLQREVDRIGRALGIAVIGIAVVVVTAILLTADLETASDLVDVLLVGVSLAVAAVPEGLPAVLSVVLALGVQRMAGRHAIVKRLSSVETLGSASVVCSDKTGTLTQNEMTIERVVSASGEVEVTGSGYRPEGELRVGGRPLDDPVLLDEVRAVLVGGSLANDAVLREDGGQWTIQGDPTEAAFLVAEAKVAGLHETRASRFERVGEVPVHLGAKADEHASRPTWKESWALAVVTKGAPDVLLARCTEERAAGEGQPADGRTQARRALATSTGSPTSRCARSPSPTGRCPSGRSRLRTSRSSASSCTSGSSGSSTRRARGARRRSPRRPRPGIRVIMITGDHPRTAARIAGDLGIVGRSSRTLTGAELEATRRRRSSRAAVERRLGLRPRRARAQAAHRRRPAGRRATSSR